MGQAASIRTNQQSKGQGEQRRDIIEAALDAAENNVSKSGSIPLPSGTPNRNPPIAATVEELSIHPPLQHTGNDDEISLSATKEDAEWIASSLDQLQKLFYDCTDTDEASYINPAEIQDFLHMAFLDIEWNGLKLEGPVTVSLAMELKNALFMNPHFIDEQLTWPIVEVVLQSVLKRLAFHKGHLFTRSPMRFSRVGSPILLDEISNSS